MQLRSSSATRVLGPMLGPGQRACMRLARPTWGALQSLRASRAGAPAPAAPLTDRFRSESFLRPVTAHKQQQQQQQQQQQGQQEERPGVKIWEAGSPTAVQLLQAARWTGLDDLRIFGACNPSVPHLSPHLLPLLDVIVVTSKQLDTPTGADKELFCALPWSMCPPGRDRWDLPHFNTRFLNEECGFRIVSRSCAVLHVPEEHPDDTGPAPPPALSTTKPVYAIKGTVPRSILSKLPPQLSRGGAPPPPPPPAVAAALLPQAPLPPAPRILTVFINGLLLPGLADVVAGHHNLYASLSSNFRENEDRPGLYMAGIRCNDRQLWRSGQGSMPPDALNVGYYVAKSKSSCLKLADPRSRVNRAVGTTCSSMASMEAAVAPVMAHQRQEVAELLQHPGILPGISRSQVPAFAVGVSKGFKNHIHRDEMYGGLTGTITWNTSKMQPGDGLTFCVWAAKVLFDLQAHPASMVMIPGDVMHGTPGLPPPEPLAPRPNQLHEGVGVVTITTHNLSTQSSKAQLHLLNRRISDRGEYGRSFERYRRSKLFASASPMYCRTCGEGGRPVPCGEPNCTRFSGRRRWRRS